MCLAKLYREGKSDEPILEDIAYVRLDGEQTELQTLLGESRVLTGKVYEIDFMNSKIIIKFTGHLEK